ncbi:hypothetical protein PWP93_02150 [Paraburkholderia sp. A1RI-2L]|uniref:hypothetical protein n=1 Tax=Paraburkholderia sp. A1RI-2L TaxID=3028367 RepID=UPI003B7CAB87
MHDTSKLHAARERAIERLRYSLAKQVPDMECGFTIQTSYGDLRIEAEDAPRFVALARAILQKQLKRVEVQHG